MDDTGSVRPARPEDARAVAEVHVAGWRTGYRGLFPQPYLDALDVDAHEQRWARNISGGLAVLVHVGPGLGDEEDQEQDDDGVDGFAAFGPARDDDVPASAGEVYGLYVHPGAWGRGAGGALLAAAVEQLAQEGLEGREGQEGGPPVLWALEGNRRARRFYAHQGWVEDGGRRRGERPGTGEVPGIAFTEVRYRLAGSSLELPS